MRMNGWTNVLSVVHSVCSAATNTRAMLLSGNMIANEIGQVRLLMRWSVTERVVENNILIWE